MTERATSEVEALALRLASLLEHTSVESRYWLEQALGAAEIPGVGGQLVIEIPRRVAEQPKIKFLGGVQQITLSS